MAEIVQVLAVDGHVPMCPGCKSYALPVPGSGPSRIRISHSDKCTELTRILAGIRDDIEVSTPVLQRYHCYTEYCESVVAATVQATSPSEAAEKAADQLGLSDPHQQLGFTVVPMDGVQIYDVKVHKSVSFHADQPVVHGEY
jgi:hypothetical protein